MTSTATADEIRSRLAKAERDRDTFHAARMQEQYLAACSMVDALGLQLDALGVLARTPTLTDEMRPAPGAALPTQSADAGPCAPNAAPDDRERQMSALHVSFDGRQYRYRNYRYDRLEDALNYARLQPAPSPDTLDEAPSQVAPKRQHLPSDSEKHLMETLGITSRDGRYLYREYRYDQLADAIAYAQLSLTRGH